MRSCRTRPNCGRVLGVALKGADSVRAGQPPTARSSRKMLGLGAEGLGIHPPLSWVPCWGLFSAEVVLRRVTGFLFCLSEVRSCLLASAWPRSGCALRVLLGRGQVVFGTLTFERVLTISVAGFFGCLFGTLCAVCVRMVSVAGVCGCLPGVLMTVPRAGGRGIPPVPFRLPRPGCGARLCVLSLWCVFCSFWSSLWHPSVHLDECFCFSSTGCCGGFDIFRYLSGRFWARRTLVG